MLLPSERGMELGSMRRMSALMESTLFSLSAKRLRSWSMAPSSSLK